MTMFHLRPKRKRPKRSVRTDPKVLVCFGTRPEVIKLAPVLDRLREHPGLAALAVTTAQHRELLDQMLATFRLEPDIDLALMSPSQPLDQLAGRAIAALGQVMRAQRPAAVVVQGDTTTALCAAIAASYSHIPVAHVEAGLRTHNRYSPFPEEINRRMIAAVTRWHFCPTSHAAGNLLAEGFASDEVYVTGNTVVDALHNVVSHLPPAIAVQPVAPGRQRLLVTVHRRETQGQQQRDLLEMLAHVAASRDVEVILPIHPNPAVREPVREVLGNCPNVQLIDPLDYASFVGLLRSCDIVLSDSGGLQEEAPALGIPLLVMRDTTERPEGVEAGCVLRCGTDPLVVEQHLYELLDDPFARAHMAAAPNPYGDGRSAARIVEILARGIATPAGGTAAIANAAGSHTQHHTEGARA